MTQENSATDIYLDKKLDKRASKLLEELRPYFDKVDNIAANLDEYQEFMNLIGPNVLLPRSDAAAFLRKTPTTITNWDRDGRIQGYDIYGRKLPKVGTDEALAIGRRRRSYYRMDLVKCLLKITLKNNKG